MTAPTPEWSAAAVDRLICEVKALHDRQHIVVTTDTFEGCHVRLCVAAKAAQPASPGAIGESAHDHGNCQLCDHLEHELDETRNLVGRLVAKHASLCASLAASPGAEVVERVARAIYVAFVGPMDEEHFNHVWVKPAWEKCATAAITAYLTALQPPRRTG